MQAAWPERSVGNPLFDRLPWWFDGLHGLIRPPRRRAHPAGFGFASVQNAYKPSAFFNVEGWWWRAREMDDACPKAVEAEEELDFLAPEDGADGLHGALAAGAFERIAAPHPEDDVMPEGAHVPGSTVGWRGNEEDLGRWRGLRRAIEQRFLCCAMQSVGTLEHRKPR